MLLLSFNLQFHRQHYSFRPGETNGLFQDRLIRLPQYNLDREIYWFETAPG